MRSLGHAAAVVTANLVLVFLVLELGGLATFSMTEGGPFYGRSRPTARQPRPEESAATTQLVLHPILGFMRRPGLPVTAVATRQRLERMVERPVDVPWVGLRANNFGFFSDHDYPFVPTEDAYVIGIFGGSVAQWFALQGTEVLVDRLRQVPGLEGRRVEVLNFAQGAFKQPQQVQVLAYFLARSQPLDFVVNLDGFNDVVLALNNTGREIDPSLPSAQQLLPLIALLDASSGDLEPIGAFARVTETQQRLRSLETRMAETRSAAVWLVMDLLRRRTVHLNEAASAAVASSVEATSELIYVNPFSADVGAEAALAQIGSLWMQASLVMDGMLGARGIPYLHVIQPNQYFSKKPFSAEEERVAVAPDSPYAEAVAIGYPVLLERAAALRVQGVHAVSAVSLFDTTTETVYADNCCHLNQRGNEMLAGFVAEQMSGLIDRSSLSSKPNRYE